MTRDERQQQCLEKWVESKCRSTIVAVTGFGKSRIAINCIKLVLKQKPYYKVIIIVPTTGLRDQWYKHINDNGLGLNAEVIIINTASKTLHECDLLVLDEVHLFSATTFIRIFETIKYKYILGLTATFERLDGKHELMAKYCPVVDEVSLLECSINGWVAPYKEYQVILDVDNIDEYKALNKQFTKHFEFFNYSFDTIMACLGKNGYIARTKLRDERCPNGNDEEKKKTYNLIMYHATQAMKLIQARKEFINNHPKKIEIARRIIEARSDKKIITFSNNIKMAKVIGMNGQVYTGRDSKKRSKNIIDDFSEASTGLLHTVKKANVGLDVPGLSVAIMLGIDSSKINALQRKGRVIRREESKVAEVFVLVIDQTVETEWYRKSKSNDNIITIDEKGLNDVLQGKIPKPYLKPIKNFTFRY